MAAMNLLQQLKRRWQSFGGAISDADRRRRARQTAAALAAICFFGLLPAIWHLNLAAAPGWARALLLGSLLELAFVAWMASIPDRATLWVMMIVLAAAATIYGTIASIALVTSLDSELPFGLSNVRWPAFWWSALMMAASTAAAYFCGHEAQRWPRE